MVTAIFGVGIDWGSSNIRAWAFSETGAVLEKNTLNIGLGQARADGFARCLDALLKPLKASPKTPLIACGMVGARDGWQEVPYIKCPVQVEHIYDRAVSGPRPNMFILSGVSTNTPAPDIMRGEETQICGAAMLGSRGRLCLPGTHSKWALLQDGRLISFQTFVAGEQFEVTRRHSAFGQLTKDAELDQSSFAAGVEIVKKPPLTNALFQARSRVLCGALTPEQSHWFLSGCLIGHEITNAVKCDKPVTLIADGSLRTLYEIAFKAVGIEHCTLSANRCTKHALFRALQHIRDHIS